MAFLVLLILFLGISSKADLLQYDQDYVFYFPWIELKTKDYVTKVLSYDVKLIQERRNEFVILPRKDIGWRRSIEEEDVEGWNGKISGNEITISGIYVIIPEAGVYGTINLQGNIFQNGVVKGSGSCNVYDVDSNPVFLYKLEWYMHPRGISVGISISDKIYYEGPAFDESISKRNIPAIPENMSLEEEAKYPPVSVRNIQLMRTHDPKSRRKFINGVSKDRRAYYWTLEKELTWEEIGYIPGVILLTDHLGTLDESDQMRIAEKYVTDGSVHFFDGIPFQELKRIPPLFLILKCKDKMRQEDLEGLEKTSQRFRYVRQAAEKIPPDELQKLSFEELILQISQNLPEAFREEYHEDSIKLREFVKASNNQNLKNLYLFKEHRELTWDELRYVPDVIRYIDEIAVLEEQGRLQEASKYVKDGSLNYFEGISFQELKAIPPLFLMVRCMEKMEKEDIIEALARESKTFSRIQGGAISCISVNLKDVSIQEMVVKISEEMEKSFREEYYKRSEKLRNLVETTEDPRLKKLYPYGGDTK